MSRYSFVGQERRLALNCVTNNARMAIFRTWRKINPRRTTLSYERKKRIKKNDTADKYAKETYNGHRIPRDNPITSASGDGARTRIQRDVCMRNTSRIRLNYTECHKPALNHCHNLLDLRRPAPRAMDYRAVSIAWFTPECTLHSIYEGERVRARLAQRAGGEGEVIPGPAASQFKPHTLRLIYTRVTSFSPLRSYSCVSTH